MVADAPVADSDCAIDSAPSGALILHENIVATSPITLRATGSSPFLIASPGNIAMSGIILESDIVVAAGGNIAIGAIHARSKVRVTLVSSKGSISVAQVVQPVSLLVLGRKQIVVPATTYSHPHYLPPSVRPGVASLGTTRHS